MVDFQSRDTRRSLGGDDEDEETEGDEEEEPGDDTEKAGSKPADAEGEQASGSRAADQDDGTGTAPATGAGGEGGAGEESAGTTQEPEEMTYALVTVGAPDGSIDPADAAVPALDGTEARVVTRRSVEPAFDAVQSTVGDLVERPDVAAVVTFGGVGVGPDDVTPEAVGPLLDKRMDGFGELYRVLAHEREGTAVVRARVTAGLVGSVPVFCLPGDPDAARHGVEGLVLAEAEATVEAAASDDEPPEGA
ncbi:MAG: molybdopterin-binding protein [Haloarculaceae archaeon]